MNVAGCGGHVADASAGVIRSPGTAYAADWVCVWQVRVTFSPLHATSHVQIKVGDGYRIMIQTPQKTEDFQIEGQMHRALTSAY